MPNLPHDLCACFMEGIVNHIDTIVDLLSDKKGPLWSRCEVTWNLPPEIPLIRLQVCVKFGRVVQSWRVDGVV